MQFGKVNNPGEIEFVLPEDHPETEKILQQTRAKKGPEIYVGCAKWNKTDLKNFYPRGTKDELKYYATQFNSIEHNAPFYRIFPPEQFRIWRDKTTDDFRFFPKVYQQISHIKRLANTERLVEECVNSFSALEEKLGTVFLQLRENYGPKNFEGFVKFVQNWPKEIPLAVEFRHTDWYNDPAVANELYSLFEENDISNIITDTAGRRDLLHMRLTNSTAFIRYVGANHESDYNRLDDWVDRLQNWKSNGIQQICFFVHQNTEKESPLLAAYFIEKLNNKLGCNLIIPKTAEVQKSLF